MVGRASTRGGEDCLNDNKCLEALRTTCNFSSQTFCSSAVRSPSFVQPKWRLWLSFCTTVLSSLVVVGIDLRPRALSEPLIVVGRASTLNDNNLGALPTKATWTLSGEQGFKKYLAFWCERFLYMYLTRGIRSTNRGRSALIYSILWKVEEEHHILSH